jgi:hypothetical protein
MLPGLFRHQVRGRFRRTCVDHGGSMQTPPEGSAPTKGLRRIQSVFLGSGRFPGQCLSIITPGVAFAQNPCDEKALTASACVPSSTLHHERPVFRRDRLTRTDGLFKTAKMSPFSIPTRHPPRDWFRAAGYTTPTSENGTSRRLTKDCFLESWAHGTGRAPTPTARGAADTLGSFAMSSS